jgi:hypothetical protein
VAVRPRYTAASRSKRATVPASSEAFATSDIIDERAANVTFADITQSNGTEHIAPEQLP